LLLLAAAVLLFLLLAAPLWSQQPGDAWRGAQLLRESRCTVCHAIEGAGGGKAPDLARATTRSYTPATMAALLWNHGPAMWRALQQQGIQPAALSAEQMQDVYAYFYALRYFDPPGDAGRGKQVFTEKHCYRCHALTATAESAGPPVSRWKMLADPVMWVRQMWNHAGAMSAQMEREGIAWPQFSVREMADLIVYTRNLPGLTLPPLSLRLGTAASGARVFELKNCAQCHTAGGSESGKIDLLAAARREQTLSGLAVAMWNHRPLMEAAARARKVELLPLEAEEMADLLAYLFDRGYFQSAGDARRGARVFRAKNCSTCHQQGGEAPELAGRGPFPATAFAAAVWQHGPAMLERMGQRGSSWPTLTERDVADLIAFFASN
jgi:mono/diheme cytochrome c family protein